MVVPCEFLFWDSATDNSPIYTKRNSIMNAETTAHATDSSVQLPIALKNPNGDEILMRLNPESHPDDLIRRLDMEKIPATDNLSRVLGSIPDIASAIALSQSFRVVMPAGVVGKLMPLVKDPAMTGLTTTTLVGSNGQILGSAGLASMAGFVAPLVVWTVLSFLTGQFFLTQIQKNTRAIFDELRTILYFLVAKEESDLGARIEFLHYVSTNFDVLSQNSEMRLSTLTNLQKVKIESLAALKLWIHNIEKRLGDISDSITLVKDKKNRRENTDKVIQLAGETRQHINRAIASWECYVLGSTLEIQMGSVFEPSLLNYTKNSLSQQSDDLKAVLVKGENIWNDFKHIPYFHETPKLEAGDIHAVGRELHEFQGRVFRIMVSAKQYIDTIEQMESQGTSLLYHNNAFYRPKQLTSV